MKFLKVLLTVTLTSSIALTASVSADKKKKSPEELAAKYRQNTFQMAKHHFGPMAGMVKGKIDFNKDVFAKNADALALIGQLTSNGFDVEGIAKKSRAKKEIWENKAEFNKVVAAFEENTQALSEAAKSGDLDTIKPAFAKVADTCKQCHNDYREKKKK